MLYPKLKHAWPINKAPPRRNSNSSSSSCNGGINSNAMNKLGGRPPVRRRWCCQGSGRGWSRNRSRMRWAMVLFCHRQIYRIRGYSQKSTKTQAHTRALNESDETLGEETRAELRSSRYSALYICMYTLNCVECSRADND